MPDITPSAPPPAPVPAEPVAARQTPWIVGLVIAFGIFMVVALCWGGWMTYKILNPPAPPTPPGPPVPFLQIPATLTIATSKPTTVAAKTQAKQVQWFSPGMDLFVLSSGGATCTVWAPAAGTFQLYAWCIVDSTPYLTQCAVTVTGPGPNPPTPTDPFFVTLKVAYATDTDPQKAANASLLAAYYRKAGGTGVASINDPSFATAKDFHDNFDAAIAGSFPATSIPNTRTAISAELQKSLPTLPTQALDAATRTSVAATFNRIAADLAALQTSKAKGSK